MKMILFLAFAALGHTPTAPPVMPNANVVLVNEIADDCPAIKSSDGSDFDWGLVSGNADVKRCLLDLAHNLVTVEAMADWMRAQRFEVSEPFVGSGGGIVLNAKWDTPKLKENVPFWDNINIFSRVLVLKNKRFRIQVVYKNDIPNSADAGFEIK